MEEYLMVEIFGTLTKVFTKLENGILPAGSFLVETIITETVLWKHLHNGTEKCQL